MFISPWHKKEAGSKSSLTCCVGPRLPVIPNKRSD